jgi:hypothetical protein
MQPLEIDTHGILRFKANEIVRHLLDHGGIDLNALARADADFSQDDWTQFSQLIGYSLCGFHELRYVPDVVALEASRLAKELELIAPDKAGGCRDDGCEIHCGVEVED